MLSDSTIPSLRLRRLGERPINPEGEYIVYWMTAFRRGRYNFALQRAVEWAQKLGKPLVILEALRCGYEWASDRLHQFVMEGMAANAAYFETRSVAYYPYLEPRRGAGSGLLEALAASACLVVSDDFPCFFLPRMLAVAARRLTVPLEIVDSNGLLPMRAAEKVFARAYDFRRFLQKNLPPHLAEFPAPDCLDKTTLPRLAQLPAAIEQRWPRAPMTNISNVLATLPINHSVVPTSTTGGLQEASRRLDDFLNHKLARYAAERNQPEKDATSRLSPYLHFGHIAAHEVFDRLSQHTGWTPDRVSDKASGASSGWWGLDENAESFLDELITWRELGYNMCWQRSDYFCYSSLPEWAQKTLAEHAADPREYTYSLDEFERAQTHDPLWNAAQNQLVQDGTIHNYLRMLWGKKILEWTATPRDALRVMVELNNKYALDGRNPNSYSGIFWVLGRYDRAWGPERPIFGKIRYMSSENTARKVKVKKYIAHYTSGPPH